MRRLSIFLFSCMAPLLIQRVYCVFHSHLPSHASREILILFGSLTTVDPGNIHDTIDACAKAKIRISVVALAAEMKVCREMCERTSGENLHSFFPLLRVSCGFAWSDKSLE